jgi:glutamyl-tRNA synthetase
MKLRFAPSPTGYLHVGNARLALINWLLARRHGGAFLLRLDDTDAARGREDYAEAIVHDLRWLGLDWDAFFRQSDRLDRYAAAAETLKASGRLYPCFESEEELRAKREQRQKRGLSPVYDRAMLALTPAQRAAAEAGGKRPYWRFLLSPGARGWTDAVLGPRSIKLSSLSDPVLVRADGTPLYTLTSVVDDLDSGITHVVRGEDHVTNTAIQLDIMAALGGDAAAVTFGHLPLLLDASGGKLSKRLDSLSLRRLRADGIEPTALAGVLARLGTSGDARPADLATLAAEVDLSRFATSPARFDPTQLASANRRALQAAAFPAVADRLPGGADAAFWTAIRGNIDLLTEARAWWDVLHGELPPAVLDGQAEFLRAALRLLPGDPWDGTTWDRWTGALGEATSRRGKALYQPLRLALTGEPHGPEMRALLPLIGRERAARRLAEAAG